MGPSVEDHHAVSSAKNFGDFIGEFFQILTVQAGRIEGWFVKKANEIENPKFKAAYNKVVEHQEMLFDIIFKLGIAYNCWQSPALFLTGVGIGAAASTRSRIVFKSLQKKLFGNTAEEGYAIQRFMGGSAALNAYFGDTLIDNMFFGLFSGLAVGNTLYHSASNSVLGKSVQAIGDGFSTTVLTPIFDRVFPQDQS